MKIFVSYSWDSKDHKDWVRHFSDDLRRNGIDAILDQYDLGLGADRFAFMESAIRQAECVLCVCTPRYVERANQRQYGVGVETSLITPQLFETHPEKQYIPVIRERADGVPPTPDYLASLVFADFTTDECYADQLEALLRHLHQKPSNPKPDLGPVPNFDKKPREIIFMPFIFFSGSKLATDAPTETKRFSIICRALGQSIATLRYGIVGCPPHPSRVLASVEAVTGLYLLAPDAPVSHANVSFPLDYEDRQHFAALASAAVFVGGGNGTLKEFKISQELEIKPLIPVAGAGGAGEHLANEMISHPDDFFSFYIEDEVKKALVDSEGSASDYQHAVEHVLKSHKLGLKRFYSTE